MPVSPLLALTATAPDPEEIRPLLSTLGTDLALTKGPAGFSFTVDTSNGPVTFT